MYVLRREGAGGTGPSRNQLSWEAASWGRTVSLDCRGMQTPDSTWESHFISCSLYETTHGRKGAKVDGTMTRKDK